MSDPTCPLCKKSNRFMRQPGTCSHPFHDEPFRKSQEEVSSPSPREFIESRLIPPLLHGDESHQEWLRTELRKWIPDLETYTAARGDTRELKAAANKLIDYCIAHDWGMMPEPYDSINPLLKLLGRFTE